MNDTGRIFVPGLGVSVSNGHTVTTTFKQNDLRLMNYVELYKLIKTLQEEVETLKSEQTRTQNLLDDMINLTPPPPKDDNPTSFLATQAHFYGITKSPTPETTPPSLGSTSSATEAMHDVRCDGPAPEQHMLSLYI